jgi:hypothetical protein
LILEWQATTQHLLKFDRIRRGKLSLCIEVLPCRACLISVCHGVQYCLERSLSFVIIMMTTVGWPVIVWPPKPKASPAMSLDRRGDG